MRACEKVKNECFKKKIKIEFKSNSNCGMENKCEITMLCNNYKMTKISENGCKTKIIIVEEL